MLSYSSNVRFFLFGKIVIVWCSFFRLSHLVSSRIDKIDGFYLLQPISIDLSSVHFHLFAWNPSSQVCNRISRVPKMSTNTHIQLLSSSICIFPAGNLFFFFYFFSYYPDLLRPFRFFSKNLSFFFTYSLVFLVYIFHEHLLYISCGFGTFSMHIIGDTHNPKVIPFPSYAGVRAKPYTNETSPRPFFARTQPNRSGLCFRELLRVYYITPINSMAQS